MPRDLTPAMSLAPALTVVVAPPLPPDREVPDWVSPLVHALTAQGLPVLTPAAAPPEPGDRGVDGDRLALAGWVADQAVAIAAARPAGPLLLVAAGAATRGVPALGMSQRAARHSVAGYVLVDGPLPGPSRGALDWPDAPVVAVAGPAGSTELLDAARRRGWRGHQGDPADVVLRWARGWPDVVP